MKVLKYLVLKSLRLKEKIKHEIKKKWYSRKDLIEEISKYKSLISTFNKKKLVNLTNNFIPKISLFNEFISRYKSKLYKKFEDRNVENIEADLTLLPPPPIWSRVLIWTFGSGSVFLIIWSIFTNVEETIILTGEITTASSPVKIIASDSGVISNVLVSPHQEIGKDKLLIVFGDDETQERLESLKDRLGLLKLQGDNEKKIYSLKILQQKVKYNYDKQLYEMHSSLIEEGAISKVKALESKRASELSKLELEALLKEADRSIYMNQSKVEEIRNSINELTAKANRFRIFSPVNGYIQDIKYQTIGERIQQGEVLMNIIPKGNLIARVSIPSELSAPVDINAIAKLDIDAYPASDFGHINAKVATLAPTSGPVSQDSPKKMYSADLAILSVQTPELLSLKSLKPGMALTAKVRLRDKPVITTVFDILSDLFRPLNEKK